MKNWNNYVMQNEFSTNYLLPAPLRIGFSVVGQWSISVVRLRVRIQGASNHTVIRPCLLPLYQSYFWYKSFCKVQFAETQISLNRLQQKSDTNRVSEWSKILKLLTKFIYTSVIALWYWLHFDLVWNVLKPIIKRSFNLIINWTQKHCCI